jgi:hypothetical protein
MSRNDKKVDEQVDRTEAIFTCYCARRLRPQMSWFSEFATKNRRPSIASLPGPIFLKIYKKNTFFIIF